MKDHGIAIILSKMKPSKEHDTPFHDISAEKEGMENDNDADDNPSEECIEAANQILDALESKDAKFLAQALLDFLELAKESYDEGEEEEPSDEEEQDSEM